MGKSYFVAGTDTDVGKTIITCGLLEAARQQGLGTLALKPVSAGCHKTADGLRNDDALELIEAMTLSLPYEQVNPYAFEPPVAPHIAAVETNMRMTIEHLAGYCRGALMKKYDLAFIEGAGGWRVPLSSREMASSLPKVLSIPVILVVGMKLGCLNHAVLTAEAILRDGLKLAGWVGNRIDPDMSRYEENLATLKGLIPVTCLGEVPYLGNCRKEVVAKYLNISSLI